MSDENPTTKPEQEGKAATAATAATASLATPADYIAVERICQGRALFPADCQALRTVLADYRGVSETMTRWQWRFSDKLVQDEQCHTWGELFACVVKLMADRDHWKANHDEMVKRNRELRDRQDVRIAKAQEILARIVCTEPPDDGVVLLSNEGPCYWDEEAGCQVYVHQHFSPLGDALMELHRTLGRDATKPRPPDSREALARVTNALVTWNIATEEREVTSELLDGYLRACRHALKLLAQAMAGVEVSEVGPSVGNTAGLNRIDLSEPKQEEPDGPRPSP